MNHVETSPAVQAALFEHSKRPEWGLAILAWEMDDRRAYQFEDGELRIFTQTYYGLLSEVDARRDQAIAAIEHLHRLLDTSADPRSVQQRSTAKSEAPALSLDDQIRIFSAEFPLGFDGDAWLADKRGKGKKSPLKRHRDPIIAKLQELTKTLLGETTPNADIDAWMKRLMAALKKTDLVSSAQLAPVEALDPAGQRRIALLASDLLSGSDSLHQRFDRFVAGFTTLTRKPPSWQLVTCLPALAHPDRLFAVQPTATRDQAKWMAPRLDVPRDPSGAAYDRILTMAENLRRELGERGFTPKDLIDVHDFMRVTLAPSQVKSFLARRAREELSGKEEEAA